MRKTPAPFVFIISIVVFCVVLPLHLSAWSSEASLISDDVHQRAIDHVLGNAFPADQRETALSILKYQQYYVDQDQKWYQAFEHAMTGVMHGVRSTPSERKEYITKANNFVKSHLANAVAAVKEKNESVAYKNLGMAIHALEDATSPSHKGFQDWLRNESSWQMTKHFMAERMYPGGDEDRTTRRELQCAVRWAYDIVMSGSGSIPDIYFDPADNGRLKLPPSYQNKDCLGK